MSFEHRQQDLIEEARRQAQICNACRYCEGYCAVFPAMHAGRAFSDGDITQLANLCHNCRGCYYACQYTAPHEFDLNLPAALAEVRQASWEEFAWPQPVARLFHRSGVALAIALVLGFAAVFAAIQALPGGGDGFYAFLSHSAMVAIFAPAFLFPVLSLAVSLRRYWRAVGGGRGAPSAPRGMQRAARALEAIATLRNLKGGHGEGCNFEASDRFSHARRHAHHAVMYGFLLCFLSTSSGTVLHYGFGIEAPYAWYALPKLFGVPGGGLMMLGCALLAWLKVKADPALGAVRVWGGEMGFIALLFLVAATGLALYAATGTGAGTGLVPPLLALHLGSVLALFLLTPYTKMVHGAYRVAALLKDAAR